MENHEVFTKKRKRLELINEISKISRCKNNMHKSDAFLYTNNELSESESKKIILFKNHIRKNKTSKNK